MASVAHAQWWAGLVGKKRGEPMTIKNQLRALAVLAMAAMAVMVGLLSYSLRSITHLQEAKGVTNAVRADMLMLRRNEKDFLARLDPKYLQKFEANSEHAQADLRRLAELLEAERISSADARAVGDVLGNYRGAFKRLFALQQKIGFSPEDGLRGGLRGAVHKAEAEIKTLSDYQLLADMLMLRRNEKDFMLRLSTKYIDKFKKNFAVLLADLEARPYTEAEKTGIRDFMNRYHGGFMAMAEGYKAKGFTEEQGVRGEMRDTVHKAEALLTKMVRDTDAAVNHKLTVVKSMTFTVALVLAAVLGAVLVLIGRRISGRLNHFAAVIGEIRDTDDLSLRVGAEGKDELALMAKDFNAMMESFDGIIREVTESTDRVHTAAAELAAITEQTRGGMRTQQGETEQVATAINEMAATVEEVAGSTADAARTAEETDTTARRGGEVVRGAVAAINHLAEEVQRAAEVMGRLEEESEGIATILDVIRGIAEQTNLLALNAAIEAARAGDQGRGFAVVADEVRTLAQRTQESTEQIQNMIERLQSEAREAVAVMEKGRSQGDESVRQANEAADALRAITGAVAAINDKSAHIASASEEQRAVTEEVNRNITAIKAVTDETVQSVENIATSSEGLAEVAQRLRSLVHKFKV
jgi:methyl-accepting chemotaxis protein